ncbi:MAG: hypothetical protein WBA93_33600 [Microcoleaceae cyanobacterium]
MKIFEVSRKTRYNWFTFWEDEGILGLYNNQGRGRKPKFTPLAERGDQTMGKI